MGRKALKWLSIVLAVLVGLVVTLLLLSPVIFGIAAHVYKGKVEAEIAAIKAKGEPVTLADLAGPKIPDEQNGAIIYERIFREMEKPQVEKDFQTLSDGISHKKWVDDPALRAEVCSIAVRYRRFIPIIQQAVSKPKCKFRVCWDEGPMGARFFHLGKLRRLSCLLAANAVVKAKSGDMDGAVRDILLGLKVSESLRTESYEAAQLARLPQIRIAFSSLEDCMRCGTISEEQARQVYELLGTIDAGECWERSLHEARTSGILIYDAMVKHLRDMSTLMDGKPGSYARIMSKPVEKLNAPGMCFFYSDELFYIRTINSWMSTARTPSCMVGRTQLAAQTDPQFPKYAIMSAVLLPVCGRKCWDRAGADIGGDRVFLALAAYKDRFGAYPVNLAELRTKLGWKIPEDPLSGKDFIYKREGKGFLLYSIGPDLKDDGGKEPPKNDNYKGDIVWRMEH